MKQRTTDEKPAHRLYHAIALIKTSAEAERFLTDLCTPAEIQALADRWAVVPLIKAGKSYRQIYEETGVSVTTVGRVARALMLGSGGYELIYERGNKKNANKNKRISQKNQK